MDGRPALMRSRKMHTATNAALGGLFAAALPLSAGFAAAQNAKPAQESRGLFARMGEWFDQSAQNFSAGLRSMRQNWNSLSQEADSAAKTTVDNTKAAADAVARLPNTRVVYGHENCIVAPIGAPDCVSAAAAVCKSKGYSGGSSVDMTTAEVCPAKVYLAGRNSGPGCHTETFVSRVLCQ